MKLLKRIVKWCLKKMPVTKDYIYGRELYMKYRRVYKDKTCLQFLKEHHADFLEVVPYVNKNMPVGKLLKKTDIRPVENQSFFYTIDCFKTIRPQKKLLSNYTVDYGMIVQHSFVETRTMLNGADKDFRQSELAAIANLETYLDRCKHDTKIANKYKVQLDAITSLFERPALTFFEGLQRILFYNQMLWQTKHTLNGLGMLDRILDEVYQHDIASNRLTRNEAKKLIADFFIVLHEYYWYKSAALVGDTGQIIILGGKMSDGQYFRNDLTDLFIEVSQELKLPDPKVLLRCASDMPEDLLEKAVTCIATGIGAPLLSNDDIVIPALTSDGCAEEDAESRGGSEL